MWEPQGNASLTETITGEWRENRAELGRWASLRLHLLGSILSLCEITHGSEKKLDDDDDDNDDGDDDGDDNDDSGDDADDGDSGDNNAWACLVVQESEALLQIL